jgi:hypothetical protein
MKTHDTQSSPTKLFMQFLLIFWPPIFVFLLHAFLVGVIHIYDFYPWLDGPMHYLGGLSMAYSVFMAWTYLQARRAIRPIDRFIELVLVFTSVTTIAVFWEFGEYLLDRFLGTDLQVSLPNTMKDLLMGILGAGTLVLYKTLKSSRKEFNPSSD